MWGQEEEKTYDISLVKTAEVDQEIRRVADQKVLTETVTIQKGQWVWKILREKGLLTQKNFPQLLSILKELNTSLGSLDMVHPGDQVIIPLKLAPLASEVTEEQSPAPEEPVTTAQLKDVAVESYQVKPGDSIIKVVTGKFQIPEAHLYGDYLDLVKKLNPSIENINTIHPGQVVRLPIYSPQVVRKPIAAPEVEQELQEQRTGEQVARLRADLGSVFKAMGEDWVESGEHFIPLSSGGQVDLQARSFPILNVRTGRHLVVDLSDRLPTEMSRLIESSWESYRVVHLKTVELRSALDHIIEACGYPQVMKQDETLKWDGNTSLSITADWVVRLSPAAVEGEPHIAAIYLLESDLPRVSPPMETYLLQLGVKVIEHPFKEEAAEQQERSSQVRVEELDSDVQSLVRRVLEINGYAFSSNEDIPVYGKQQEDFKLVINADFQLQIKGQDSVILLQGQGPEVAALLREHRFRVLSLTPETEPLEMVNQVLEFLDKPFDGGPNEFSAAGRVRSRDIRLTLPGTVFRDQAGDRVLATPLDLPPEVAQFLSQRGYRVLQLPAGSRTLPQG